MADPHCASCWIVSVDWQDALFTYMNNGDTVKEAFDKALADYPVCASSPSCMRFAGDVNFRVIREECDYCLTDTYGYDWCLDVIGTDGKAYYLDGAVDVGSYTIDAMATYVYNGTVLNMTAIPVSLGRYFMITPYSFPVLARQVSYFKEPI